MKRYVISLGGNALGNNAEEQRELLKKVAKPIVSLIKDGNEVIIVHGNGPQVGMINLAFTDAKSVPDMPFPECGAMSQGYIGFHIQNAIYNMMCQRHQARPISTVITQVLVDEKDPAFKHPTKPIGSFYSEEKAKELEVTKGYVMVEDSGRGYRRVIASPKPIDIIEKESILRLLEHQHIVIAAGGGGIPVITNNQHLVGIDAVIDKDYASAKMAEVIKADELIILTAVEHVYLDFNKPSQRALKKVTVSELKEYLKDEHFKKGSMLPKIEAAMAFVEATQKPAVIASLEFASEAFKQMSGTVIMP
jgi:carbamate kinase